MTATLRARPPAPAAAMALLTPSVDPFPAYRRLRAEAPAFFLEPMRSWVLLRHADVAAALRDRRLSADRADALLRAQVPEARPGQLSALRRVLRRTLLMSDGRQHRDLRAVAARAFTPQALAPVRGRVRAVLDELIDRLAGRREWDGVADLCAPFPARVIARLMGVDEQDWPSFHAWTVSVTRLFGSTRLPLAEAQAAEGAALAMLDYFRAQVAARRRRPTDDLIGQIARRGAGAGLEPEATAVLCVEIVGAAHNTTLDLLATSLQALVRHPAAAARLRLEPGLRAAALDELLRFAGPALFVNRIALEDIELAGQQVRRGELVSLFLACANRDPAVFADPERLDLARRPNPHLALGGGPHVCLGAPLARLELEEFLTVVAERLPDLRPAGPVRWRASIQLRGIASLPLRREAAV